ncbi:MAG TPA: thioredoxin family protein [Flavitalea sp.]|nr:thioredoxin family protein [Flavitalea sp.]
MQYFESHINGAKPVVVDFYADWCRPCTLMKPVLEEVKAKVGDRATVLKMNIDKNPHYTQRYGIRSVPTLAIFKEGNLIWRKSGVTPAYEILKHLELLIP